MTRPSKSTVAGRIAIATPTSTPTRPGAADPVLESAAQTVADALNEGRAQRADEPASSSPAAEVRERRGSEARRRADQAQADDQAHAQADAQAEATSPEDERARKQLILARRIRAHMPPCELSVTLTDNRYTMLSVRRETENGRRYKVRLHHMFTAANPAVTRALARYVAYNEREASRLLSDFIDANQHLVREKGRRTVKPRLVTQGDVHDLAEIFRDLNERYFANTIDARITWGQKSSKVQRRNSIKMGSYSVEDKLIRIHRSLDRDFVPRFFVEWVVYHEMLHQVHEIKVVNGRRQFHSREFLRDEARFDRYADARAWERAYLDELLTY